MATRNPAVIVIVRLRNGIWCVFLRFLRIQQVLTTYMVGGHSATMYLYISSAVPNKRSLGAANGLSQVATSIQSAVGPATADWLFAFSLTHNVLGGNFAYVLLVGVTCVALGISMHLPRKTWVHHKE